MKLSKIFNFKTIGILIVFFLLSECSTVPMTGRKQLTFMNESQLATMSLAAYNELVEPSKLSNNQSDVEMIKRCGKRISIAAEQYLKDEGLSHIVSDYDWQFNLIEEDIKNAWCMPGGYVAFYTGILPVCLDETGVAVVMSHEIAHAIARHGNERMSKGLLINLGGIGLAVALKEKPRLTQELFLQSFGIVSTIGVLAFSRQHESEADHMGLMFMAMAGYDPMQAPQFWERMANDSKDRQQPPEFLSTHPSHETRISRINKSMSEAVKYYDKYKEDKSN